MNDSGNRNDRTAQAEAAFAETGVLDDASCEELFASFDSLTASDDLIAKTLDTIEGKAETASRTFTAKRGTKRGRTTRAKWRTMRVAAIAACLTLALTGGVAYATPISHVTVSQAQASIELGVNVFGITVSAESDDEIGREVIASADLRNKPFDESFGRACDSLAERNPDEPLGFGVDSPIGPQREQLEEHGAEILAKHEPAFPQEGDPAAAGNPEDAFGQPAPQESFGAEGPSTQPSEGPAPQEPFEEPQESGMTTDPNGSNPDA